MKKLTLLFMLSILCIPCAFAQVIPTAQEESGYSRYSVVVKQGKTKSKLHGVRVIQESQTVRELDDYVQNTTGRKDIININNAKYPSLLAFDPYAIKINGQKYYLVKNKTDGIYDIEDILGYNDTKSELFNDLKELNSDIYKSKLTRDELIKADVRFVAVINNKLELYNKSMDYDMNNISYIDLSTLRGTINNGKIGSFGYFDVYLANGQKIIGFVTFDSDEVLWDLIRK